MSYATHEKGGIMSIDGLTYGVAAAAISSPLWLREIGTFAGDVLPVLGVIWLAVQIAHKLATWRTAPTDKSKG